MGAVVVNVYKTGRGVQALGVQDLCVSRYGNVLCRTGLYDPSVLVKKNAVENDPIF